MSLFPVAPPFVVDSSVLIRMFRDHPPARTIYAHIWRGLDRVVREGRFLSHREAHDEITSESQDVKAWVKQHRSLFVEVDELQDREMHGLLERFPRMAAPGSTKINADPWLVLTAKLKRGIVVSGERRAPPRPAGDAQCSKIPDVCDALGIPFLSHFDFLETIAGAVGGELGEPGLHAE